jgi:hypothetical protein
MIREGQKWLEHQKLILLATLGLGKV